MAFERKRFCFNPNCKITEDEYIDEGTYVHGIFLKTKGKKTIHIQEVYQLSNRRFLWKNLPGRGKNLIVFWRFCKNFKTFCEQAWKDGHKNWCFTVNDPKKNQAMARLYNDPKQAKTMFVNLDLRNAYLMSAHFKSYRGVKVVLYMFMDYILKNQPDNLLRR